jgi:hypothetical protein
MNLSFVCRPDSCGLFSIFGGEIKQKEHVRDMPLPLVFLPEQQSFFKPAAPSIVANRKGLNRLLVNGGDCTRRKELRQVQKW